MEKLTRIEQLEDFEAYVKGEKHGCIDLAVPVINILKWQDTLSLITGISNEEIEKIIYYAAGVIKDPGKTDKKAGEIVPAKECDALTDCQVLMGAEAVEYLLSKISIKEEMKKERGLERAMMAALEILGDPENDTEKAAEERLEDLKVLEEARKRIDALCTKNFVIRKVNVLPLTVRAALKESRRLYDVYDIERLYCRVIFQNERLRKLLEMGAPRIIILNESRMLQEYVDTLLANGQRGQAWLRNARDDRSKVTSLKELILRNTNFGME